MREYKVAVLGAGGVGKSALTARYIHDEFRDSYDPTIEDSYRKEITLDNIPIMLEILDTAGLEQFRAMRELYIRNSDTFMLVYDVTDPRSLSELQNLRHQILTLKDNISVPLVLVGTKSDLLTAPLHSAPALERARVIAREWNVTHVVTSSKTGSHVPTAFEVLVRTASKRDSVASYEQSFNSRTASSRTASSGTSLASFESANGRQSRQPRLQKSMAKLRQSRSMQKLRTIASAVSLKPRKEVDPRPAEILPVSLEEELYGEEIDLTAKPEIQTVPADFGITRRERRKRCAIM